VTLPLFRPFPGVRPIPERAAEIAAPPYDVLNSLEARALAKEKPWSFLHVSKPEIDLPLETDPHAPEVYAMAARNWERLKEAGMVRQDHEPCYYVYRLTMGEHVQTGIAGAASVTAYLINRVRRHEFTRPDKEDDRVRQIEAVNAQTGPVLLAHRPIAEVEAIVARVTAQPAAYDFTAADGIGHALWVIDATADLTAIQAGFERQTALYIADGHHRSAAAARVAQARSGQGGPLAWHNSFLAVSFPIDQMRILDYNRVVRDLAGLDLADFLARLDADFEVKPSLVPYRPKARGRFGLYAAGRWFELVLRRQPRPGDDPVARLDVSLLTDRLLAPILRIGDLRKDSRIDFVGGKRGLEGLMKRVDSGEMAAAFALYPTSMEDLIAVADSNQVMPPKSTWFEPKLADGMVSAPLE